MNGRAIPIARLAAVLVAATVLGASLFADAGHGDEPAPDVRGPLQKVADIFTRQAAPPSGPEVGMVLERPGIKEPDRAFRVTLILTPARMMVGAAEEFVFQLDERGPSGELDPLDGYVPNVELKLGAGPGEQTLQGQAAPVAGEPGRYKIRLTLTQAGEGAIQFRVGSATRGLVDATFPLAVASHSPPAAPWMVLAVVAGLLAFSLSRRRSPAASSALALGAVAFLGALVPFWTLSGRGRASTAVREAIVAQADLADDLAPHEMPEVQDEPGARAAADGNLGARAFGMVGLRDGARAVVSAPQAGVLDGIEIVPRGTNVQAGEMMARLRVLNLELAPEAAATEAEAVAAAAALEVVAAQWERAQALLAGEEVVGGAASEVDLASGRLAFARRQLERAERLLAKKVVSAREVEEAALELSEAEIDLERAVNTLRVELVAAQAQADSARLAADAFGEAGSAGAYRLVEVAAPFSGVVTAVSAMPGAFVEEGEILYELIQPDGLWLDARLYEHQVELISAGAKVTFRVSTSSTVYLAVLESLGREIDSNSTLPSIFAIQNPDTGLIPGQQAVITIEG